MITVIPVDVVCTDFYYLFEDTRPGVKYQWVVSGTPPNVNASDVTITSPRNNQTYMLFPEPGNYCIYSEVCA